MTATSEHRHNVTPQHLADQARRIAVGLEQQNARLLSALHAVAAATGCDGTTKNCPARLARAAIEEAARG